MAESTENITQLLRAVGEGDRTAVDELFHVVYNELRTLAHAQRRRWTGNETLNTTAIVHEAYLKLVRADQVQVRDRSHFFTLASRAMRQVLVNYARDQQAEKRGGGVVAMPLDSPLTALAADPVAAEELIALDRALTDLEGLSERSARVVECRFFAGLTVSETAEALGTSVATVKRDWSQASTWLRHQLEPDSRKVV